MEKYQIRAPFSGVISMANITENTLARVGQKLGELTNTYVYEMEAAVLEQDIDLIKVGSQVTLYSETTGQNWKGTVARISQTIDPSTQTIKVFIRTAGKGLKEGMYLSALAEGRKIDNALEIDRNLLMDQNQVYHVQDSTLKLAKVNPVYYSTESRNRARPARRSHAAGRKPPRCL